MLLVVLAVGFAYSMGAHYTGACMGMPHALAAISARRALAVMAPLTLIGAAFASHGVEHTVGHDLLAGGGLSVTGLVIVIGVAFGLTSALPSCGYRPPRSRSWCSAWSARVWALGSRCAGRRSSPWR